MFGMWCLGVGVRVSECRRVGTVGQVHANRLVELDKRSGGCGAMNLGSLRFMLTWHGTVGS